MNEVTRISQAPSKAQVIGIAEANPFLRAMAPHANAGTVAIESERAIAEAQGKLVIAKRFPRDEGTAFARAMDACKRRKLAEVASYSYPRAGQTVTGPSIRLAEELARCWGNIDYGIRELSRKDGLSEMEAYCWDLETNVMSSQKFTVRHLRDKKGGPEQLHDERDIYEITANMGGRRLRARILAVLPPDLVDAAVDQCRATLAGNSDEPLADRIKKMTVKFAKLNVTADMLAGRLGHPLDKTNPDELADLVGIYQSLKDGVSRVSEWFGVGTIAQAPGALGPTQMADSAARAAETRRTEAPQDGPVAAPTGQAPQPAPASKFEAWLTDEYGEQAQPEPMTDPAAAATWLVNHWMSSRNRVALIEHNRDWLDEARAASAVAAEILANAVDAPPTAGQDQVKSFRVAVPQTPKGAVHIPNYVAALTASLATDVGSLADLDAWIADNAEGFAGRAAVAMKVQTAIDQRRAELGGAPAQAEPPVAETSAPAARDADAEWTDRMISEEIAIATSRVDLETRTGSTAIKTRVARYERDRPDLHARIAAAYKARQDAFTRPTPSAP